MNRRPAGPLRVSLVPFLETAPCRHSRSHCVSERLDAESPDRYLDPCSARVPVPSADVSGNDNEERSSEALDGVRKDTAKREI
jgi:hypothetical protein